MFKIASSDSFLYCTNRYHDSIAAYRIAHDGRRSLIETRPSLGAFAQNLAITDDCSTLVCSNMGSSGRGEANIVVFRIDNTTGRLKALGAPIPAASPACSVIV